jgi:hypothetical protein
VSLRRILRLFTSYRVRLAVVLGLIAVSSAVSLVPPFLLRRILDVALPQDRLGLLSLLALIMIVTAVGANALGVLESYLSLVVGQEVMNDLRNAVYGHRPTNVPSADGLSAVGAGAWCRRRTVVHVMLPRLPRHCGRLAREHSPPGAPHE